MWIRHPLEPNPSRCSTLCMDTIGTHRRRAVTSDGGRLGRPLKLQKRISLKKTVKIWVLKIWRSKNPVKNMSFWSPGDRWVKNPVKKNAASAVNLLMNRIEEDAGAAVNSGLSTSILIEDAEGGQCASLDLTRNSGFAFWKLRCSYHAFWTCQDRSYPFTTTPQMRSTMGFNDQQEFKRRASVIFKHSEMFFGH